MARYIDAELLEAEVFTPHIYDINRDDVIALIADQPTADVEEVKHGEWKKISVNSEHGYGQIYYQHSSCKVNSTELFQCPYERCPRCGAKMDGGKAE